MSPEDYTRVRDLFDRALTLPASQRRRFIDDHMPTGDPLRTELLAMVDAGDDSSFLARAAGEGMIATLGMLPPGTPERIGNYRILRVLGRGGMGVVYLALRNDDVFHKVVALKVIGDALDLADTSHVERFKRERQILAGLDHPNIARILDGGNTDDNRPFYVMEYVAGSPIDDYCQRMNTDVPTRVRLMAQACDAIEYLHNNAIAHRDIKPQNILVTADGRVKLVDFGIAKVDTAGMVPASSDGQPTMIMTPGYASPEQIAGDPSSKGGDIYSVAVVLYQLLTGKLPYVDPQGRPNIEAQLSGKAPEPPSRELTKSQKLTPTPTEPRKVNYPDLDRVVLTALQRDPLQRYSTVQLFADDLRRCLDGRPIVARPSTVTYRFSRFVSRNQVAAAVVAVAVLAAGGGVWLTIGARMERVELKAKEVELERFVSMLNTKVSQWGQPAVPAEQKVADVQAASQLMTSATIRDLSQRAPDPARVKQLVGELRRILERADEASANQAPIRKEIAVAFRTIGDFEKNAPLPQLTDKKEAVNSYRRAARIAADICTTEKPWAEQQISELSGLLGGLGATPEPPPTVEATTETIEPPPPPPVDAPPPRTPRVAPASAPAPPALSAEDRAAREELTQRLRAVSGDAERAHHNVDVLQASLASSGQTLRSDIAASLSAADGSIEDAKSALDDNDLMNAEDALRRAAAQLRKVFQAVGG
jgi:serine/threonine-protein kinase